MRECAPCGPARGCNSRPDSFPGDGRVQDRITSPRLDLSICCEIVQFSSGGVNAPPGHQNWLSSSCSSCVIISLGLPVTSAFVVPGLVQFLQYDAK